MKIKLRHFLCYEFIFLQWDSFNFRIEVAEKLFY